MIWEGVFARWIVWCVWTGYVCDCVIGYVVAYPVMKDKGEKMESTTLMVF